MEKTGKILWKLVYGRYQVSRPCFDGDYVFPRNVRIKCMALREWISLSTFVSDETYP